MEPPSEGRSRELPAMFRPPVNRAMRSLDRSFFRKTVPISAARVFQNSDISSVRKELSRSKDLLVVHRLNCVRDVKDQDGLARKALLLREDLRHDGI
jgi:tRNA (guanine37-N1)-methyltransferase